MSWPKAKTVPDDWKAVERSFKRYRDRRVQVTLAKVSCLEEEDQVQSAALALQENLQLKT